MNPRSDAMNPRSNEMNGRCNSHPIRGTAKIIFALPTALTAALVMTAVQPAAAQPGWVLSHQKISDTEGGFTGILDDGDQFGNSVASLGDLDGDGVSDLVVGAYQDDDGGNGRGAAWVLFLNTDGTVKRHQKISDREGGFTGVLDDNDFFGLSLAPLGDLDGDGVGDLAVGAIGDDDGAGNANGNRGAVWVLFLNPDGTVKSHQKISDTEGGFTGTLDDDDWFGHSVGSLGDLDGDGVIDLAVGAVQDDDGGNGRGAVWVLFLDGVGGGACNGNEIIAKVKCKTKRGKVKRVIVKLKKGTPDQEYTAELDSGEKVTKKAKRRGKVRLKFTGDNRPPCGNNGVTITPCDLKQDMNCNCG